ncbi:hypothetical protein [Nocardia asiatica]|uniref:hypothetical protein n=1 Tax=Nocardia asiatica TaxID=209252 RepID=UPI0024586E46|nr:hypothetical protein [Nocardia asiatica]
MDPNDKVKVAIQPLKGPDDHNPDWRIIEVTYGSLDHPDDIGEEVYDLLRAENPNHNGYRANLAIMVSPDVPGYPAGCSVRTENRADARHYHDRYRQAWREHWNCEHHLFAPAGTDPDRPRNPEDPMLRSTTANPTSSKNGALHGTFNTWCSPTVRRSTSGKATTHTPIPATTFTGHCPTKTTRTPNEPTPTSTPSPTSSAAPPTPTTPTAPTNTDNPTPNTTVAPGSGNLPGHTAGSLPVVQGRDPTRAPRRRSRPPPNPQSYRGKEPAPISATAPHDHLPAESRPTGHFMLEPRAGAADAVVCGLAPAR